MSGWPCWRRSGSPPQSGPRTQGGHVRRSAEFKILIASGSPTSLISATLVRPWAYSISSLGLPTKGDCRSTAHGSDSLWRSVFGGRAEALEDDPDLDSAEPCPAQELESPPHPLLDVVAELP